MSIQPQHTRTPEFPTLACTLAFSLARTHTHTLTHTHTHTHSRTQANSIAITRRRQYLTCAPQRYSGSAARFSSTDGRKFLQKRSLREAGCAPMPSSGCASGARGSENTCPRLLQLLKSSRSNFAISSRAAQMTLIPLLALRTILGAASPSLRLLRRQGPLRPQRQCGRVMRTLAQQASNHL
jgi:hypothetical protein